MAHNLEPIWDGCGGQKIDFHPFDRRSRGRRSQSITFPREEEVYLSDRKSRAWWVLLIGAIGIVLCEFIGLNLKESVLNSLRATSDWKRYWKYVFINGVPKDAQGSEFIEMLSVSLGLFVMVIGLLCVGIKNAVNQPAIARAYYSVLELELSGEESEASHESDSAAKDRWHKCIWSAMLITTIAIGLFSTLGYDDKERPSWWITIPISLSSLLLLGIIIIRSRASRGDYAIDFYEATREARVLSVVAFVFISLLVLLEIPSIHRRIIKAGTPLNVFTNSSGSLLAASMNLLLPAGLLIGFLDARRKIPAPRQ